MKTKKRREGGRKGKERIIRDILNKYISVHDELGTKLYQVPRDPHIMSVSLQPLQSPLTRDEASAHLLSGSGESGTKETAAKTALQWRTEYML